MILHNGSPRKDLLSIPTLTNIAVFFFWHQVVLSMVKKLSLLQEKAILQFRESDLFLKSLVSFYSIECM